MGVFRLQTGKPPGEITECEELEFGAIGVMERAHIQEWLVNTPSAIDPDLMVVSAEYDAFDQTKERIDILGAFPVVAGVVTLAVVELKRHGASTTVDLQAIKYAAYVSTLDFDSLVEEYGRFWKLDPDPARAALRAGLKIDDPEVDDPTVGDRPSIILVAPDFRPEITATVLWLEDEFAMDVRCVRLAAHAVGEEIVVATQTILPLPEAQTFRIGRRAKKLAEEGATKAGAIDPVALHVLMAGIPPGRWTTYGAVATVLGSPGAGLGVGTRLRFGDYPNAHRVLAAGGKVAAGFSDGHGGGPEVARARLQKEGLDVGDDLVADPTARLTEVELKALLTSSPA